MTEIKLNKKEKENLVQQIKQLEKDLSSMLFERKHSPFFYSRKENFREESDWFQIFQKKLIQVF